MGLNHVITLHVEPLPVATPVTMERKCDDNKDGLFPFDVSTIDKFTQKIIRNFAYEIKLPVNYEVEIKANDLLEESTAKLISRAGVDMKLTKALINFSFEKSSNDKSWDIEYDLNNISKLLLNENHFDQISEIGVKNLEDFEILKKQIDHNKIKIQSEIVNEATDCLNLIYSKGLDDSDFLSQALPKHLKKVKSKKSIKLLRFPKFI